jgi:hypothetical protein
VLFVCCGTVQGKSVVRLKGGCPSTLSRVSSEAAALAAAGLAYEMVPGVSSATAAPVLAGAHTLANEDAHQAAFAAALPLLSCKSKARLHFCCACDFNLRNVWAVRDMLICERVLGQGYGQLVSTVQVRSG